MAAKRQFVSDLELQDTLAKLQKKNEEEIELIGQLSSQCDQLVKEVKAVSEEEVSPISDPPIEVTTSTKSSLVINSYVWNYKGQQTHWNPFSHTLVWNGKKFKSASIYYMIDDTNEYQWYHVDHWEYFTFDYGDSEILEAELNFKARTRSNDISNGFGVDTNNSSGYWTDNFDYSVDNSFYMVSLMRTDEADPFTGTYDHLKIFMNNLPQQGRPLVKAVKGLIKIAKVVATHVSASVETEEPLQLMASREVDDKIKLEMISKPASMDMEILKKKAIDYMKSPLLQSKVAEDVPQDIIHDEIIQ